MQRQIARLDRPVSRVLSDVGHVGNRGWSLELGKLCEHGPVPKASHKAVSVARLREFRAAA